MLEWPWWRLLLSGCHSVARIVSGLERSLRVRGACRFGPTAVTRAVGVVGVRHPVP